MSALPEKFEKHSCPRIHLLRELKLVHENGTVVRANLRDISPGGMRAMCDRDSAAFLVADGLINSSGSQAFASFNLPVGSESLEVEVDCRMMHLSLVENDRVAIGLRFVSFRGNSLENLRQFILDSLEPSY